MYCQTMLTVGKADNGYIIECTVPLKKKVSSSGDSTVSCDNNSTDKQFIATSEAEAAMYVQKMLPLLDAEYSSEEEFASAFNTASGIVDKMDRNK